MIKVFDGGSSKVFSNAFALSVFKFSAFSMIKTFPFEDFKERKLIASLIWSLFISLLALCLDVVLGLCFHKR
jgi:hypothetical protein